MMRAGAERTQALGYALAAAASVSYGASLVLAKQVVEDVPALVGSALGMVFGTLVLGAVSARDIRRDRRAPGWAFFWAGLSGLAAGGGIALLFLGMSRAPVVVVAPVVAVNPLAAILFGQLFIRRMERLSWRMVLGALLVVAGVVIISLGRNA